MTIMNLLDETLIGLKVNGLSPDDVAFVQTEDARGTWDSFSVLAADIDYDDGYGGAEISTSLVIVGRGWWLERKVYDGAECWTFKEQPLERPLRSLEARDLRPRPGDDDGWW